MASPQTDNTLLEFDFSIRQHLKQAWRLFADHAWYFVVLTAVLAILNLAFNGHHGFIIRVIALAATLLWSYVIVSSALAAVDGKHDLLEFGALKRHFPTWQWFGQYVGVIIGSVVIITGGFILLIIPGIYFMVRLMFSHFAMVDRKQGVMPSLRFSWFLVRKDIFWTSLLCLAVAFILIMVGVVIVGIGALVTYPVSLIFLALLYRELSKLPSHEEPAHEQSPIPEPISAPATEVQ